jgi:hypothetical protein
VLDLKLSQSLRQTAAATGHVPFGERMAAALQEGLSELDALPRDDVFWRGWSNHRATATKLHDYASKRLEQNPADRVARWALVALSLAYGANDGGLHPLGPEIAVDPTVVVDALVIADWIGQEFGFDLTSVLREVFARADRTALEELAHPGGREINGVSTRWSSRLSAPGSRPSTPGTRPQPRHTQPRAQRPATQHLLLGGP